ncbi:YqaA family protein [Candidatus Entotheonella palauensis]|uniref:YqaA family protein n=1 Tax=Candidatus Entotheonella palauensis TaxID=93172 RepID=UPI000B7F111F|nr:YqaA family protein [Candidatus Entotheonella palauensis]
MITSLTYAGLFASSFLAATLLPFSSEALLVALLLTEHSPMYCVITATLGNGLGGMSSYGLGYLGNMAWIERYLRIEAERIERARTHIARFGSLLAFLSWLPVVGDVIAVALGFFKVRPVGVAIYMFAGKALRYILITIYTLYQKQA